MVTLSSLPIPTPSSAERRPLDVLAQHRMHRRQHPEATITARIPDVAPHTPRHSDDEGTTREGQSVAAPAALSATAYQYRHNPYDMESPYTITYQPSGAARAEDSHHHHPAGTPPRKIRSPRDFADDVGAAMCRIVEHNGSPTTTSPVSSMHSSGSCNRHGDSGLLFVSHGAFIATSPQTPLVADRPPRFQQQRLACHGAAALTSPLSAVPHTDWIASGGSCSDDDEAVPSAVVSRALPHFPTAQALGLLKSSSSCPADDVKPRSTSCDAASATTVTTTNRASQVPTASSGSAPAAIGLPPATPAGSKAPQQLTRRQHNRWLKQRRLKQETPVGDPAMAAHEESVSLQRKQNKVVLVHTVKRKTIPLGIRDEEEGTAAAPRTFVNQHGGDDSTDFDALETLAQFARMRVDDALRKTGVGSMSVVRLQEDMKRRFVPDSYVAVMKAYGKRFHDFLMEHCKLLIFEYNHALLPLVEPLAFLNESRVTSFTVDEAVARDMAVASEWSDRSKTNAFLTNYFTRAIAIARASGTPAEVLRGTRCQRVTALTAMLAVEPVAIAAMSTTRLKMFVDRVCGPLLFGPRKRMKQCSAAAAAAAPLATTATTASCVPAIEALNRSIDTL